MTPALRPLHRLTHLKRVGVIVLTVLFTCSTACGASREIFVCPDGDDMDPGTMAQPLQTLEAARDALRQTAGDRPVTVWLRGGVYERQMPFRLTDEDSGTEAAPVVYRAWPGEEVRVVGGRQVEGWTPVTDGATLSRLTPTARGHVVCIDLRSEGLTHYGVVKGGGLELFFDDKPMTLSRWPNAAYVFIAELVFPGTLNVRGKIGSLTGAFVYEGTRPTCWLDEKDVWVYGYWFHDWADEYQEVESIDVARCIVTIVPPYHEYGYRVGQWFYWLNILAELDTPGEWYLDRDTGILYFWPPSVDNQKRAVVSTLDTLVVLKNVSHVTFRDMIFEVTRGTAVVMEDCHDTKAAGCVVRNCGGMAVRIDGGYRNGVIGCDISQVGDGAIEVRGGDRLSLTPGNHAIKNNHIQHYGRWNRTFTPGIAVHGVGQRIAHNLIHDAPYTAIMFWGNDHLIESNEIRNVCLGTNDGGAIYAGCDWTMRGTKICGNYLHDITGFQGGGSVGVYLDDMFSGTEIRGNLFERVTRAAFLGGGRDNRVENNIFLFCEPSLHVDARGLGWASAAVDGCLTDRLNAVPYTSEVWRNRYPELVGILEDDPAAPKGNRIRRNISFGGAWDDEVTPGAAPYVQFVDNWIDMGPYPPDTEVDVGALQGDSRAVAIGFEPLDMAAYGLYRDEYRRSVPEE